jgi:hypothetical protein
MKRLLVITILVACSQKITPSRPIGPENLKVEIVSVDAWQGPEECAGVRLGNIECPRPFVEPNQPMQVTLQVTALNAELAVQDFTGEAQIDVRPGRLANVGPRGQTVMLEHGKGQVTVQIVESYGVTRFWVEHCGTAKQPGTFATGVSEALWFAKPRIDQLNATMDGSTSALVPVVSNICAIIADPRYTTDTVTFNNLSSEQWVGYSHGKSTNVPPPPVGEFLEIQGCSKAEFMANHCSHGPLVVTGIGSEGFYISDLHPDSVSRGFNHLYVFNFSYPDHLQVGDLLTWIKGTPAEFSGTTQLVSPEWRRYKTDQNMLPPPITIDASLYQTTINGFGANKSNVLDLEKLEGALVCMDNLAPASFLRLCDVNDSGGIERAGCLSSTGLPPLCSQGMGQAPAPPDCNTPQPFCFDMTEEQFNQCSLTSYIPAAPAEYCCERSCYADPTCTEQASYVTYGQWNAEVYGHYENATAVKIGVITRSADPTFDPLKFAATQRQEPDDKKRQRLKIVGNLRQVLAGRPVWILVARSKKDIEIGGSCARP